MELFLGWLADPKEIRLILSIPDTNDPKLSISSGNLSKEIKKRTTTFYGMGDCKFRITATPLSVNALSDEYLINFSMKKKGSTFVLIAHALGDLSFSLDISDERSGMSGKTIVLASELSRDQGLLVRPILNSNLQTIGEVCIQYLLMKPFVHPMNNFSIIPSKQEELEFLIGHRVNPFPVSNY